MFDPKAEMNKPYTERIQVQHGTDREFIIREFSHETDSSELVPIVMKKHEQSMF